MASFVIQGTVTPRRPEASTTGYAVAARMLRRVLVDPSDPGSVIDAGCGSGVLAVAAARLGFAPVRAVDLDEVAVGVARETARLNDVAVEVAQADVLQDGLPVSDVVVANIELAVVQRLLDRLTARHAVTSGYLGSEQASAPGWEAVDRVELEGWAADVLAKRH